RLNLAANEPSSTRWGAQGRGGASPVPEHLLGRGRRGRSSAGLPRGEGPCVLRSARLSRRSRLRRRRWRRASARRPSGKPSRRPATPPPASPLGRRIAQTAIDEFTSFGGHRIDSNGRIFRFGLTEAEHDEDEGGNG